MAMEIQQSKSNPLLWIDIGKIYNTRKPAKDWAAGDTQAALLARLDDISQESLSNNGYLVMFGLETDFPPVWRKKTSGKLQALHRLDTSEVHM